MDTFAKLPNKDRKDLLQEATNRRDSVNIITEKDFWVCWTLKRLFSNKDLAPHLIFKGGTSLSKAYGLIDRFSEDIDLTISRKAPFVSEGPNPMEAMGNERRRRIDTLRNNAQVFIHEYALPKIKSDIEQVLGSFNGWELSIDEEDKDQQTLLFHFPKVFDYPGYIKPYIKLEFGARGDIEPSNPKIIGSYVASEFPEYFSAPECEVSTLAAERTFWEKITILHALCNNGKMHPRMSRHFYDVHKMANDTISHSALSKIELLEKVVKNKTVMWWDASASYETAKIGTLQLIPDEQLRKSLEEDYKAMEEMFMGSPPSFQEIMRDLKDLEDRINQLKN